MIFLIIVFCLIFNRPVWALPSITINSAPDVITAGDTFPVTFTINEASSSASYFYKFFGGVDNDVYKITNGSNLSYTSGWSDFPQITLDSGSSNVFTGIAFIKSDVDLVFIASTEPFRKAVEYATIGDLNSAVTIQLHRLTNKAG